MAYVRCKHLDADHVRAIREDHAFRCKVEIPMPVFPVSVTKEYTFKWPPSRSYVSKEHCARCPLFEPKD